MTWLDRVHVGDCLELMRAMADHSVDAVVTDPPYGIRFMGEAWDGADIERTHGLSSPNGRTRQRTGTAAAAAAGKYDLAPAAMRAFQLWTADWAAEAFRVLRPGGHLLSFASCRTYHRMACGIEDAGFEIRDQLAWVFGSGFPKSLNLSGAWDGWGTALKPGWEPIALARKPLTGTVAQNVEVHGVGALNIDGCRIGGNLDEMNGRSGRSTPNDIYGAGLGLDRTWAPNSSGRWPANLVHDGSEEVLAAFPDAPGQLADASTSTSTRKDQNVYGSMPRGNGGFVKRDDSGSAARFFYCAKASRAERDAGLDYAPDAVLARSHQAQVAAARGDVTGQARGAFNDARVVKNNHPTVKPVALMRWLCRLVTPSGGLVLDPFTGSGSTGVAAALEGFKFIGCEMDPQYVAIASARIAAVKAQGSLF